MNMNLSRAIRGLVCLSMVFSFGVAMPTVVPGVAEAEGAQPRSSVDRRLRPGAGFFANSPQSRSSQPAAVSRPVAPMMQPGSAVVRAPQVVQPQGQIVNRPMVPQQGVVVQQRPGVVYHQQPGVVYHQQPRVVQQPGTFVRQPQAVQQPMTAPQGRWISAPQR